MIGAGHTGVVGGTTILEVSPVIGKFPTVGRHAQVWMTILFAPASWQSEYRAAANQSYNFARRLGSGGTLGGGRKPWGWTGRSTLCVTVIQESRGDRGVLMTRYKGVDGGL